MKSTAWLRIGDENDLPIHVVPEADLRDHDTGSDGLCPCLPMALEDGRVIRHNSYDRREVGEVCRVAIRSLLAGPPWTKEQSEWLRHAEAVLEMHWPEPVKPSR